MHLDSLVPLALGKHHYESWHSTFDSPHGLVLPSFFFTSKISEAHGEVEGHNTTGLGDQPKPYDLHLPMPLANDGQAAL